jgi:hypothetical protein
VSSRTPLRISSAMRCDGGCHVLVPDTGAMIAWSLGDLHTRAPIY